MGRGQRNNRLMMYLAIVLTVAARFAGLNTLPAGASVVEEDAAADRAAPLAPGGPVSQERRDSTQPGTAAGGESRPPRPAAAAAIPAAAAAGGASNAATKAERQASSVQPHPVQPRPAVQPVALAPGKVVMGYWARWGDEPYPQRSLAMGLDVLDFVVPYWYTLQGDGSLAARERDHAALMEQVRGQGRQVLILVNNGRGSRRALTDPAIRAVAVENLYRMIRDYGAAGVQIDFEGLSPDLRDSLSEFVRQTAERLRPAGYLTTVAVGPKRSAASPDNDGAQAYDYEALGRAADLVVLMTYDQHGTFSGPGPVAGLPWVEDVVRHAVSAIPREKILLGVAGYGYDWSPAGIAIVPARTAAWTAARHDAVVTLDARHLQPNFGYADGWGRWHQVWYESAESASLKLGIVNRYGLGGVAVWSLGQESPDLWPLLRGRFAAD